MCGLWLFFSLDLSMGIISPSLFTPGLKEIKYSPWHWCLLDNIIY